MSVKRCVVTFPSTTGAMAMEAACMDSGTPGRLIPIPRSITAGCGLCWAAPIADREAVEAVVRREKLEFDGVYEIEFPR